MSLLPGGLLARLFAQCRPDAGSGILVDRLIDAHAESSMAAAGQRRTYTASATVTLFSVPLVSRSGVGSGYALVEQAASPGGTVISIQFGAGSYPESARGLNRLGLLHEVVLEQPAGRPRESAYYALMTTSPETNLTQARKAVDAQSGLVPYVAAQASGNCGVCSARIERMDLPPQYTWRNADTLLRRLRAMLASWPSPAAGSRGDVTTFLYAIRRALAAAQPRTNADLFFNLKRFALATEKVRDPAMGRRFADRKLVASADAVMRLNASIQDRATGGKTPFRIWFEAGSAGPPLRFEYQARPFLRLAFEADVGAQAPAVPLALKS